MNRRASRAAAFVVLAAFAGAAAPAEAFFRAGGWHAGGFGPAGGAWHAGGWHAGGWAGGGYWGAGFHGPVVVNHYYAGGCWACGGAAVAAGVAAGAAAGYAIGSIVATLPPACAQELAGSVTYYVCGGTWYQPYYGNNGVYYRVVAPR